MQYNNPGKNYQIRCQKSKYLWGLVATAMIKRQFECNQNELNFMVIVTATVRHLFKLDPIDEKKTITITCLCYGLDLTYI